MEKNTTSYITGLSSLRGIAALMVVMHHFTMLIFPDIGRAEGILIWQKSYLFVDMFFILSGYVMCHVYQAGFVNAPDRKSYRRFMSARFARIYPLHILTLAILVIFEFCYWLSFWIFELGDDLVQPFSNQRSLSMLITNIFMLQAFVEGTFWNQPAWSISTEFVAYFFVPVMLFLLSRLPDWVKVVGVLASFSVLAFIESRIGHIDKASVIGLIRCFAGCGVGMVLCLANRRQALSTLFHANLATLLLVLVFLSICLPISHVVTVLLFAWLIACVANLPDHKPHWLTHRSLIFLGTISYSIYMLHWMWFYLAIIPVKAATGQNLHEYLTIEQQWGAILAFLILLVYLSNLCYKKVEVPWRVRLRSYLDGRGLAS